MVLVCLWVLPWALEPIYLSLRLLRQSVAEIIGIVDDIYDARDRWRKHNESTRELPTICIEDEVPDVIKLGGFAHFDKRQTSAYHPGMSDAPDPFSE